VHVPVAAQPACPPPLAGQAMEAVEAVQVGYGRPS
jgi:hypothetical protein